MARTVTLITGLHITATDKRNILAGIDYLRVTFASAGKNPKTGDYYIAWRYRI